MSSHPQQPGSTWPPTRPPYPTLSTPNASAFPSTTSNPASTSSISSDMSTASNSHGASQTSSQYQPPMPSPTISQSSQFSPFQPTMTAEERAHLARLEAQLRGLHGRSHPHHHYHSHVPGNSFSGQNHGLEATQQEQALGLGFGAVMPQPQSMRAVESRREVVNKYVRENALLSEAATRLMIREMDDIRFE